MKRLATILGVITIILMAHVGLYNYSKAPFVVFHRGIKVTLPPPLPMSLPLSGLLLLATLPLMYLSCKNKYLLSSAILLVIGIFLLKGFPLSLLLFAGICYLLMVLVVYGDRRILYFTFAAIVVFCALLSLASIPHYIYLLVREEFVILEVAKLEALIFYLLDPIIPILLLTLFYMYVILRASKSIAHIPRSKNVASSSMDIPPTLLIPLFSLAAFLPLCLIYAIHSFRYPRLVGVDLPRYMNFLQASIVRGSESLLADPRLMSMTMLYAINTLTQNPRMTVRITIMLTSLIYVICAILAARKLWGRDIAAITGIATALSPITASGLYAAIMANWLALGFMYLTLAYLPQVRENRRALILSLAFSILTLLSHPWTWDMLMALILIYALYLTVKYRSLKEALPYVTLMAVNLAVDRIRALLRGPGGMELGRSLATHMLSLSNLYILVPNLKWTFHLYVGGSFDTPLLLILAIIGGYFIYLGNTEKRELLLLWSLLIGLVFPFAHRSMGWRLLFNTPTPLLAGVGLYHVLDNLRNKYLRPLFLCWFIAAHMNHIIRIGLIAPVM